MPTETDCCSKCKYWKGYKKTKGGRCRRYPVQTPTDADNWCGEFEKVKMK